MRPLILTVPFVDSIEDIRRITGGGTVYHDEFGEVTYSIILKENDPIVPTTILESYDVLCQGVINGLKRIGLDCKFIPINDIIVKHLYPPWITNDHDRTTHSYIINVTISMKNLTI